jgi:hypothetical protein
LVREVEAKSKGAALLMPLLGIFDSSHLSLDLLEAFKHEEMEWNAQGKFVAVSPNRRIFIPELVTLAKDPVLLQEALGLLSRDQNFPFTKISNHVWED